jgi:DNA (cytosine-5)-methyltransferase 1
MNSTKTKKNLVKPKIVSLFSGAGGLDLGFEKAGFLTVWANEYDKTISPTYQKNFSHVEFDGRSISNISDDEIKLIKKKHEIVGVIGGPPCQSWSAAGAKRGIDDPRGRLFHDYIRFIKIIKPAFFVAENVHGLIHSRNRESFEAIKEMFSKEGYLVDAKLLNSSDYDVPQDRLRVFIIGYKRTNDIPVTFPTALNKKKKTLFDAIGYLANVPVGSGEVLNHDLTPDQTFSSMYMSRNRVREWGEQSFTILAMDRHVPIHPSAPKMKKIGKDKMAFDKEYEYRRFTVRECAEIQTFPSDFNFIYSNVRNGYKMIGNAVPVKMAYHVAKNILNDLFKVDK